MLALAYAGICFSFIGGFILIAFCHASGAADDASDKLIDQIAHGDRLQLPSDFHRRPNTQERQR